MAHTTVTFEDEMKKGKETADGTPVVDEDEPTDDSSDE